MNNYSLPKIIETGGASFAITNRGDYRMVLDCFSALNDEELNDQEKLYACLMIFYEDINGIEDIIELGDTVEDLVKQMFLFFNCNQENPGHKTNHKLIDWDSDAMMIISSINRVSGQEIRDLEYLHWWTFMGYYMEIGECTLSYVVSIRHKIVTGKKLEKYEREFKQDNPEYFNIDFRSAQEKQDDDYIRNLWNKGGET